MKMTLIELVIGVIAIPLIVAYVVNGYKLTQCDFEPANNWKCEITHGIGLIPPLQVVTVWVDTDPCGFQNKIHAKQMWNLAYRIARRCLDES